MTVTVDDILAPGGVISQHLGGYERRDEQLDMARAVAAAFAKPEHLLAEAGTGVGKSFAYLVPAILQAVQNHQRAVLSTYTIALQEQLIAKDLPFLSEVMPVKFTAVLGKGRGNYICFRRLAALLKNRFKLLAGDSEQQHLD
jgi:ATP-dependent DNA helicase DinG